jgi:hypothetical protein
MLCVPVYDKAKDKLDEVVKEYKLDMENDPIIITGGEDRNDHVKTDTIVRYRSVWRSLYKFCFLVGDNESALLLNDDKRPANPLPIKEETLRLYMQFMTKEEGSILHHPMTLHPVTDVGMRSKKQRKQNRIVIFTAISQKYTIKMQQG